MKNKVYQRKCVTCKEKFTPQNNTQICCSPFCAYEYVKKQKTKEADKIWKKQKKELKESLKTKSDYESDLQDEINHIARLIDKGTGCISCGGHTTPAGGHYHSRGANQTIRFHLDNIHLQDFNCNNWKSANLHHYDLGLIERYGKEYWEFVKFGILKEFTLLKLAKNEFNDIIKVARQIVSELKKADLTYPPKVRLKLRKKYNERLGIYK